MARETNDPDEWTGTRTVIPTVACGFCSTKDHNLCPHEIPWFDKLWICGCDCNKSWKPKDVVVKESNKSKWNKPIVKAVSQSVSEEASLGAISPLS
jgi:C4-type Zn-finger protein